ncbi:2-C-methyl-D-erythritol 4-phosphate cytidylyltransferase [Candidatus Sumerlaeota bacterium]|nr:2-C-methyl-D-erythritol 4-phosphate cytidylyltransferase [Candidatus Sumerlaeota bacterium]
MSKRPIARAVIVAAGKGTRFGGKVPKQFAKLGGRMVLLHAMRALAEAREIREMVIVRRYGPRDFMPLPGAGFELDGITIKIVEGGERRQDSVAAGLAAFSGPCDVALVHDAARPFPPVKPVRELIRAVAGWNPKKPRGKRSFGGGLLAIQATDTVKEARPDGSVARTLDRSKLWLAQTPQAIHGSLVPRVVTLLRGKVEFTDESAALEFLGVPVLLVEGAPENFKITRRGDLKRAEAMLGED